METYINAIHNDTAIPPAVIQAIIAIVMQLIAGCTPKPPTPAALRKSAKEGWAEFVLNRAIREGSDVRPHSDAGRKLKDSMIAHAVEVNDDDAVTFLSLC